MNFKNIPMIASCHHEKMDGTGYPFGLKGEDLSLQAKILSIIDIFDALTASDRPYKPALELSKALDILKKEADRNSLDLELVNIFIDKEVYKGIL